jgi:hypothetical protein
VVGTLLYVSARKGFEQTLPVAALFLIVFPEESKLPILGLFDITTQRLVTIVLICLAMTAGKRGPTRKAPLKGWIIAIALWWTVATVNSITFTDSFKSLLSLVLDYLAIYLLYVKYVSSVQTVRRILFGVVGGLFICSFFGVIEAYGNWSVVSLFPTEIHRFGASGTLYVDDARGIRIQSTFGHPILFGSALAMGIPMTLYLLANTAGKGKRLLLWLGLMLMFTSIFKTSSRGPWMALAFSLIPFLFFGQKQFKRYIITICVLALTVMVVRPGVWETLWNDYAATVDEHSSQGQSYEYRYELYHLVIEKLGESPARMIWGYGPQSFPALHLGGTIDGRGMAFASCDSSIAALLAETGYVGLAGMGLFLSYVLLLSIRGFRALPFPRDQMYILFFANLTAFYFEMTNVAILGWGQQTILLWVIIAMTLIYRPMAEEEAEIEASLDGMQEAEEEELALPWERPTLVHVLPTQSPVSYALPGVTETVADRRSSW